MTRPKSKPKPPAVEREPDRRTIWLLLPGCKPVEMSAKSRAGVAGATHFTRIGWKKWRPIGLLLEKGGP